MTCCKNMFECVIDAAKNKGYEINDPDVCYYENFVSNSINDFVEKNKIENIDVKFVDQGFINIVVEINGKFLRILKKCGSDFVKISESVFELLKDDIGFVAPLSFHYSDEVNKYENNANNINKELFYAYWEIPKLYRLDSISFNKLENLMRTILKGVEKYNFFYGDFKYENIMEDRDNDCRYLVCDFDIYPDLGIYLRGEYMTHEQVTEEIERSNLYEIDSKERSTELLNLVSRTYIGNRNINPTMLVTATRMRLFLMKVRKDMELGKDISDVRDPSVLWGITITPGVVYNLLNIRSTSIDDILDVDYTII